MLKIAKNIGQLDVSKLMETYSIVGYGRAVSEFYEDLLNFFSQPGAIYALWEEDSVYRCCLRVEPYKDGVLIAGIETMPQMRNKGYATKLLRAVVEKMLQSDVSVLYSHVDKGNIPSRKLHTKCGFVPHLDYAVLLDRTVSQNMCTLCVKKAVDSY